MTHAALKDLDARIEAVRKREKDGCPLARELRVLREMCSCGNDDASVSEAEARYLELAAISAMEGEDIDDEYSCAAGGPEWQRGFNAGREQGRREVAAPPPQQADPVDRGLHTPRRVAAVELLQAQGWKWDGKVWIHPTPSPGPQGGGEAKSPYGYCPTCGAKGAMRERRPNGDDICANNHKYPSRDALATPPAHQPGEVASSQPEAATEVMIRAGGKALYGIGKNTTPYERTLPDIRATMEHMAAVVLTAALAPKEAGHG